MRAGEARQHQSITVNRIMLGTDLSSALVGHCLLQSRDHLQLQQHYQYLPAATSRGHKKPALSQQKHRQEF